MKIERSILNRVGAVKAAVDTLRVTGFVRYPPKLRRQLEEALSELRTAGVPWKECGRLLGVCVPTLYGWSKKESSKGSASLVRVNVKPDERYTDRRNDLVLRTPGGFELSGFDLMEAAQLVRALG